MRSLFATGCALIVVTPFRLLLQSTFLQYVARGDTLSTPYLCSFRFAPCRGMATSIVRICQEHRSRWDELKDAAPLVDEHGSLTAINIKHHDKLASLLLPREC